MVKRVEERRLAPQTGIPEGCRRTAYAGSNAARLALLWQGLPLNSRSDARLSIGGRAPLFLA